MKKTCKSHNNIHLFTVIFFVVVAFFIFPRTAHAASYQYRVVYTGKASNVRGKTPFASASGSPGVNMSITSSREISNEYSFTMSGGVTPKNINAAVGFGNSYSRKTSVSNGGNFKVPSTSGGKKVKRCVLRAYAVYERRVYRVDRRTVSVTSRARGGRVTTYGPWKVFKANNYARRAIPNYVEYTKQYTF